MEVPRKRAKACPDGIADSGAAASTAARQIAELQAELDRCRREKNAMEERHDQTVRDLSRRHDQVVRDLVWEKNTMEERHDQVVRDLKGSYSDALEWVYTLEVTHEDWLGKGHSEAYTNAMVILQQTFKYIIKELRMGTVDDRIVLGFDHLDEEGDLVMAAHDDVLMPYWEELANALVHWSEYHANGESLELSIARVETPDAVLDVLRPAIKQSKVQYLGFTNDGSPQPWKFAEFIGDVVWTNHQLTEVVFHCIMLSNREWKTMCNAIRIRNGEQSSIMSYFELSKCFAGGVNIEVLKAILTSNTEEVNLAENGMSAHEAPIIAGFLNANPPLARLNLDDNRFDDADAAVLANVLSSNTNLTALGVSGNTAIKSNGRLAFLRVMFDVSSLASCAASNQTCRVMGLEQDISALNCYTEASYNKWDKIFAMLALSSEDAFINTALLSEIPASLMPVLLDRADDLDEKAVSGITDIYLELTDIKRCRKHYVWDNLGEKRRLSCVYELFRSLVVPSIYV